VNITSFNSFEFAQSNAVVQSE